MSTAAKTIAAHGLARRALSLGAVKAFDQAMQFLLPIVLVRCLDAHTFGEYRLLWLVVGTVMALSTLNMCGVLFYFLPRADARKRRLYVHQTLLYLLGSGLVCAWAVSSWNPLLPAAAGQLAGYGALVPAFVGLWIFACLLDYLPTVDERIGWQARATLGVSGLRVALLAAGAWLTSDLRVMLWLLLVVVAAKIALLGYYVHRHHGLGRPWFERASFGEQFRHAAPLGASAALYSLRGQSDQWVAASLFALSSFAAFSVAAIVGQVVHLFRHSVMEAFLPSMSRMHAAGDTRGTLEMNSRANVIVGTLLFPLLAIAFVFADEIITLVYTRAYAPAAPVMRVYVVAMICMVIEMGSMVLLLRQGPFSLGVSALILPVSIAVSWGGAHVFGLPGAAAGSALAIYVDRALMLRQVSRHTGISVAKLQDWGSLSRALLAAAGCGVFAWWVVGAFLYGAGPLARLVAGTCLVLASYLLVHPVKARA